MENKTTGNVYCKVSFVLYQSADLGHTVGTAIHTHTHIHTYIHTHTHTHTHTHIHAQLMDKIVIVHECQVMFKAM